jgi:hypothetical protein
MATDKRIASLLSQECRDDRVARPWSKTLHYVTPRGCLVDEIFVQGDDLYSVDWV